MRSKEIIRPDKITSLSEYKGTIESSEMGHYEMYIISPLLRDDLGMIHIDSGSMVSIMKESLEI
jgi:hypothetical protein